jgi:hypothetical protein
MQNDENNPKDFITDGHYLRNIIILIGVETLFWRDDKPIYMKSKSIHNSLIYGLRWNLIAWKLLHKCILAVFKLARFSIIIRRNKTKLHSTD